jgi:hypothetical protein
MNLTAIHKSTKSQTVTDWQNHSIRGFLSAQVGKKMGLKVESTKSEAGERTYRING